MLKRAAFLSILSGLPLAAYLYGLCTVQPAKSKLHKVCSITAIIRVI